MDEVITCDELYEPGDPITESEAEWLLLGPWAGGVPGLIRRVRRTIDVSQRGLAAILGISQSRVARWETGRVSPPMDMVLWILREASLVLRVKDSEGQVVEPMRDDGGRDIRGRRHPAHADLYATSWWAPRGSASRGDHGASVRRSRLEGRPQIRYQLSPLRKHLRRLVLGTPVDHPSERQLAAHVEWCDEQRDQLRVRNLQRIAEERARGWEQEGLSA